MSQTVVASAPKPETSSGELSDRNSDQKLQLTWSRWIFAAGVLIFFANMAVCWSVAWTASSSIEENLLKQLTDGADKASTIERAHSASANEAIFLNRLLEAATHIKAVSNKQTMVVVAMAGGFSLMAIGFALFVMGIESAYSIKASGPELGSLVIRSSAPGLVAFILAATILCFGLTNQSSIHFSGFTVYPDTHLTTRQEATLQKYEPHNDSAAWGNIPEVDEQPEGD